jgi:hypothetical protein
VVSLLNNQAGYLAAAACELLELPHSTFSYQSEQIGVSELEAVNEDNAGKFPLDSMSAKSKRVYSTW